MNRRRFLQSFGPPILMGGCGLAYDPSSENTGSELPGGPRLGLENVCFITDEFSQNLDEALTFAREFGITRVEIRSVDNKYCFLHEPAKLKEIQAKLNKNGVRAALLATPVMKCVAPGFELSPDVEDDVRAADLTFPIPREEQYPRTVEFLQKAVEAAKIFETDKIRVFSFWRAVDPAATHELILEKLNELAGMAQKEGMKLCIENEDACNVATCREAMTVVEKAPSNVGVIWDVMNGAMMGESAYPDGYGFLDKSRIHHVHVKDLQADSTTGARKTVAVGDGVLPYAEIFKALADDGYQGALSMETHFSLNGSKQEASRRSMKGILKALGV